MAVCVAAADPAALRDEWIAATEPRQRVTAGLALLDQLLSDAWAADMAVDLAMLGLPEPGRREAAMSVIDEGMVVSSGVEADLRTCGDLGIRVGLDTRRWQRARGVVCAASALLKPLDTESAAEALAYLQSDQDARSRRLLAHLRAIRGDAEALTYADDLAGDLLAPPIERVAATAVALRLRQGDGWRTAVERASTPWEVAMLAESAMAGAASDALTMVGPVRQAWMRVGLEHGEAFALAVDLSSRSAAAADLGPVAGERLDAAAVVAAAGQTQSSQAAVMLLRKCLERPLHASDSAACNAALGRALEQDGRSVEAMAAWRTAAEGGGNEAGRRWDHAAQVAATLVQGPIAAQAMEVLNLAASRGEQAADWTRTLAAIEAQAGDTAAAIDRLRRVPPGGGAHLAALSHIGTLIAARRASLGHWGQTDADLLHEARAAAMAAASQRRDARRSALAMPVAAELAAMLIEHELDISGVAAASRRLDTDPASAWLPEDLRRRLRIQLALAAKDYEAVSTLARDSIVVRDVLLRADSLTADEASSLVAAVRVPLPSGPVPEQLVIAGLLARAGATEHAVAWYDAVLTHDPALLPAVLGRCECLRQSSDRAVLADVAAGYRRIAALPRLEDPARWRLANLRLIAVLRRAGVDPERLDARLARLRSIDPELGRALP